jgi:acyl-CoA reductase-like NAD-dependent aldehyde dehydrogenase
VKACCWKGVLPGDAMKCPLILSGNEVVRRTFKVESPFYAGYQAEVAQAGALEVSAAIGSARRAERLTFPERRECLERAAQSFTVSQADIEHAVKMTGVPVTHVESLFSHIPHWLREVPAVLAQRFPVAFSQPAEEFPGSSQRLLISPPGFCYAVTPGNDPRASALVAANLAALGIPFILRASVRDALAPLVIRALLTGGFDPHFCSLLYFEGGLKGADPETRQKNFHLVDTAASVWTFGPDASVDAALRFETRGRYAAIDLPHPAPDPLEEPQLCALLTERGFQVQEDRIDHFTGKIVLRHNSGNCAAVLKGGLSPGFLETLRQALAFPLGCTATKSLMLVDAPAGTLEELGDFLHSLKVGDPLDSQTEVGYISSATLDFLSATLVRCRPRLQLWGGERLSAFQSKPVLIASQEDLPEIFAHEIPAHLLAVRSCRDVKDAADQINHYTVQEPRLAVSLHNLGQGEIAAAAGSIRTHSLLINQPTSRVTPYLHEGNDYASLLLSGRWIPGSTIVI